MGGIICPPPPSRRCDSQTPLQCACYGRNLSMRGPTQPDPVTPLRTLYLWNGLTDSRAVFFVRCHHLIYFVLDRHRYPPVPATARGTCRLRGCRRHPTLDNSITAGPIA